MQGGAFKDLFLDSLHFVKRDIRSALANTTSCRPIYGVVLSHRNVSECFCTRSAESTINSSVLSHMVLSYVFFYLLALTWSSSS